MEILGKSVIEFDLFIIRISRTLTQKNSYNLASPLFWVLYLIATYLVIFTMNLTGSFRKLLHIPRELRKGKLPSQLEFNSEDEFGQIASDLNNHTARISRKKSVILPPCQRRAQVLSIKPEDEDELGNALVVCPMF